MTPFLPLFERARTSRDDYAWQSFVDAVGPYVHRCLDRCLCDLGRPFSAEDLDDLAQEVYLRLLSLAAPTPGLASRVASGRQSEAMEEAQIEEGPMKEGQVRAYVIRVAVSVVIDRARWRGARKRHCASLRGHGSMGLDNYPSSTETPEERVLLDEHLERILAGCRRVVGGVERRAKLRALELVLFAGMQSGEAAKACGGRVSAGSIDVLVSRVRGNLAREGIQLPRRCGARADRRETRAPGGRRAIAA